MKRRTKFKEPYERPERYEKKRSGGRKFLFLMFVAFLFLLWFAPTIILRTSLREFVLEYALSDFPGKVTIGSASAGWMSPISIQQLTVADANGEEVAKAETIQTQNTLLNLVLNPSQLGVIRIEKPQLNLVLRDDGSNVEDLLKPYLDKPKSSSSTGCTIEIVDGQVVAAYEGNAGRSVSTISDLDATVGVPRDAAAPMIAKVRAELAGENQSPGKVALDAELTPAPSTPDQPSTIPMLGAAKIQSNSLPLELLNPWLRLFGSDVQLGGLMNVDAELQLAADKQTLNLKQFAVTHALFASPSLLGPDQPKFASLTGSGEIVHGNGELNLDRVALSSDVGTLQVTAQVPATSASAAELLRRSNGKLESQIDLARLAALLPNTLRIREGSQVTGGQLAMSLASSSDQTARRWTGNVEAANVAAVHQGRRMAWSQPITARGTVQESNGIFSVQGVNCRSSFLELTADGTLEQGHMKLEGDLTRFVQEMGQFIDLGSLRAAGQVNGQVGWTQAANQVITLTGNTVARNLELSSNSMKPWKEQQVSVDFTGTARTANSSLTDLTAAKLNITAAGDQLTADLRQPISSFSTESPWPVNLKVKGDLGQWLTRCQMFFSLPGWQIDGKQLDVSSQATLSLNRIELAQLKGSVQNLQVIGPGVHISEPILQLDGSSSYDMQQGEFQATNTTVTGTTLALQSNRFVFRNGDGGAYQLDGDINYRTDLGKLTSWMVAVPQQAPTYRINGEATGSLRFMHSGQTTKGDLTADIEKFAYATPVATGPSRGPNGLGGWQNLWQEPRLKLTFEGAYDAQAQHLQVDKLEAAGESLSFGAAGGISQPFDRCDLQLAGQYAYDLERLTERMKGLLGSYVAMKGSAAKPFSIRGPLFAGMDPAIVREVSSASAAKGGTFDFRHLQAETSVAWESLLVQGMQIGQGEIQTSLNNGMLNVAPFEMPVSDGKVRIAPRLDLTKSPSIVEVEPATIVDQVRITPEACRSWLKYLAPLVADATAAEGRFSVALKDAKFPVSDPTGGNVEGQLMVHSAQIGPGPLAQEIITLAQQIRTIVQRTPLATDNQASQRWLQMPEQQLNFQLADHRVYHRDLQMNVRDIVIRTQGWVGVDQQLALVAEVPVLDEWVANDRYFAALKGQTIRLPINGTLSRPQVDRRALAGLGTQTIREAGTNLLQQELNRGLERGLERLFQPKNPAPQPQPTP